jgi:hypothetical protein
MYGGIYLEHNNYPQTEKGQYRPYNVMQIIKKELRMCTSSMYSQHN